MISFCTLSIAQFFQQWQWTIDVYIIVTSTVVKKYNYKLLHDEELTNSKTSSFFFLRR